VTNIAANTGALLPYTLVVPAGASNLHFNTSGGTGDADLYVRFGSPPTLSDFDCVSGTETTTESCVLPSATAGTWYVLVNAYSKISGVSLVGSYAGGASNHAPTANFSFTTSALTANFTDSSTDSDGSIASRSWNFGDGATATTASPSHTYANPGTYTVTLTVTDNGGLHNSTSKPVTVSSGGGGGVTISIADASVTEGSSLSRNLSFTVKLSQASSTAVKYNIATADGTATAPSDYTARTITGMSIPAGTTSKTFLVSVKGDTLAEPNETFNVTLSNVTGATVADGSAVGTIVDDDGGGGGGGTPSLSIANITATEGNSGAKAFVFTVKLSAASTSNVTYNIATANGTAMAGSDYVAASASGQVIPPGQTSKTFTVNVNGDTTLETNERFKVNVTGVTGATVLDSQGIGIITNDD
jgi:PKD repeat protein